MQNRSPKKKNIQIVQFTTVFHGFAFTCKIIRKIVNLNEHQIVSPAELKYF